MSWVNFYMGGCTQTQTGSCDNASARGIADKHLLEGAYGVAMTKRGLSCR